MYHDQLVGDMVWAHQRSQNDRKHWVFRDKQLYTYIKNSLKNTDVYERICDLAPTSVVDMDTEQARWVSVGSQDLPTILRCGVAGIALEIATNKYGKFTVHDNMVTEDLIRALSSTEMDLLEYIQHARSLARRVDRSEGSISDSMLPTRFMAGFEGDSRFEHAYLETAKEIEAKRRAGSAITFEYAAGRMEYWHIDVLHPKLAVKPVHINGRLVNSPVSGGNMRGKRTGQSDEVAGVNTAGGLDLLGALCAQLNLSQAQVREGLAKFGPKNDHTKTPRIRKNVTCTNVYCKRQGGHDTADCFAYGGGKEGQFLDGKFRGFGPKILQLKVDELRDLVQKHGKSPYTPDDWEQKYVMPPSAQRSRGTTRTTGASTGSVIDAAAIRAALTSGNLDKETLLSTTESAFHGAGGDGSGTAGARTAGVRDAVTGKLITSSINELLMSPMEMPKKF